MADHPPFESPITGSNPRAAADHPLVLADESSVTKLLIRADDDSPAARHLGVGFGASRLTDTGVLISGQRPTEWLLVGDTAAVAEAAVGIDRDGHVSLVDHTHSRAMLRLTGDDGPKLLEKVNNLDWSDPMTPNGAVVSASVARVTCDIIRQDTNGTRSYRLACDRSFAQYLLDALLEAGREFDIAAAVP
ncbi:MAG: sarcosine oxidase subunit gamma family protein [Actinomycetota bacterium]